MARAVDRLSARSVQSATAPGLYPDGYGLYLKVAPSGSRSWILRYRHAGRRRDMGLGRYPLISLAEARQRAEKQRRVLADGIDPLAEKRSQRAAIAAERAKAMTFGQSADAYIAAHRAGWRGGDSERQWRGSLRDYAHPVIADLPVQSIDVALVMRVLEPIWTTKPETASRIRGRIESVLDWATARGYRQGDNPARWRGHLENLLPKRSKVRKVEHHAALPYSAVAGFVAELRRQEGVATKALEFAILTAARSGEVIGAKWSEFDLNERLWAVPANRMKAAREHRVPLSGAALAILQQMAEIRTGDFVFPGERGRLSGVSFFRLLRRMGHEGLTTHGFRSSFRDFAAERTNFPREVAELALAHAVGDATERAYQRSDLFAKRRQLSEAWAKFCAAPATAGEVIAIRR
jgi:integrase